MLAPLSSDEWSLDHAAHLLSRAGFGGAPAQIRAFHALGLDRAANALLSGRGRDLAPPAWTKDPTSPRRQMRMMEGEASEEQRRMAAREARREDARRLVELRAWWLERMRSGGPPLVEKMTLFWHGHFATSVRKVESTWMMWRQNQTFREHALGDFRSLLRAMARDPAMIRWLDLGRSRAGAPNENFARELLELFTLGVGHYTEEDVKNAARAFTGHRVDPENLSFAFERRRHDYGRKLFLGQRGRFDGDGVIDVILAQPRCARFVAGRVWEFFAYEEPEPAAHAAAAETFYRSGYRVSALLREMFRSAAFYSPRARRTHIKSPVEWLVQTALALETDLPRPEVSDAALRQLGQALFAPPNVRGWEGGRSWISTSTLMMRYNFASRLLGTADAGKKSSGVRRLAKADLEAVAPATLRSRSEPFAEELALRLYGTTQTPRLRERALAVVAEFPAPRTNAEIRHILERLMNTPDYQLS